MRQVYKVTCEAETGQTALPSRDSAHMTGRWGDSDGLLITMADRFDNLIVANNICCQNVLPRPYTTTQKTQVKWKLSRILSDKCPNCLSPFPFTREIE